VLTILLLVVAQSKGADFDGDWRLDQLTCEELVSAYNFNLVNLQDLIISWKNCMIYADSEADTGHGLLHCALIKKEGKWLEGLTNDIVAVFNAKFCGEKE
jgi:hypothetical protein